MVVSPGIMSDNGDDELPVLSIGGEVSDSRVGYFQFATNIFVISFFLNSSGYAVGKLKIKKFA